jgi:hypothetical protein
VVATDVVNASRWRRWIARASGGSSLLLAGCLVTDHPQYGEPNVPAHLVRGQPDDFAHAGPTTLLCGGTGTSSSRLWMAFRALVSDANIDDPLEARIYVNGEWQSGNNVEIAKTGSAERDPLIICAPQDSFDTPCNLVEVRVSRRFALNEPEQPAEAGDVSLVSWWIFDETAEESDVAPVDCAMHQMERRGLPP